MKSRNTSREFQTKFSELKAIFEQWPENALPQQDLLNRAYRCILEIAWYGERLFLYYPTFGKSPDLADFRAEKDLHKHWNRYTSSPRKLHYEVERFVKATEELLNSFDEFQSQAESFLVDQTRDLSKKLPDDFITARDLFSVGVDEGGAFFAGRGLESVLREIARTLKIRVEHKGKQTPLDEMDLADVAEAFRRARWKSNGHAVIDRKGKALLDLLRAAHNATAHGTRKVAGQDTEPDWREIAKLSAKTANAIWLTSGKGRKKLTTTNIVRDW